MNKTILFGPAVIVIRVAAFAAAEPPGGISQYWEKTCASCHGMEGKADTKAGRKIGAIDFTDPKNQEKFTDEQMFKAIKEGVKDKKGKFTMKPAENVNDEQIKSLVARVRAFKR
ncbi:MAG: c-type cytochrome [Verrucomicrobia bacterium]|nr:c-type cytochrome [Verrucomicrobiota bacterium]